MATLEETLTWRGHEMVDREGQKIGSIEEIYLDAETNEPEWALVNTGMFGTKRSFVPLREASREGEGAAVRVPFEKSQVKDAPKIEADGQLSEQEETDLYRHYGLEHPEPGTRLRRHDASGGESG